MISQVYCHCAWTSDQSHTASREKCDGETGIGLEADRGATCTVPPRNFPLDVGGRPVAPWSPMPRSMFPLDAHQLRLQRTRAGLTQVELASKAFTTPSYISRLESGRQATSAAMARRLAEAMGADVDDLYDETMLADVIPIVGRDDICVVIPDKDTIEDAASLAWPIAVPVAMSTAI